MTVDEIVGLTWDGLKKFDGKTAVYIRPMYWAEHGGYMGVPAEPSSTRFCLCLYESPMIASSGFSITVSPFRRPTIETMPTNAKAGCLYPNNGRAILEAKMRGFDNALVLDMLGNVAETATSNIFLVKDGQVVTPAANGTFLSGITRARTIALLAGQASTSSSGRCRSATSWRPTRCSRPATIPRSCRSPASRIAICSPVRSPRRRANSIGSWAHSTSPA